VLPEFSYSSLYRIARRGEFVEANQSDSIGPAFLAKIFLFSSDPNQIYIPHRPAPHEGRVAIVTDAGRDAVDAESALDETC
jgi:hypothetical protein